MYVMAVLYKIYSHDEATPRDYFHFGWMLFFQSLLYHQLPVAIDVSIGNVRHVGAKVMMVFGLLLVYYDIDSKVKDNEDQGRFELLVQNIGDMLKKWGGNVEPVLKDMFKSPLDPLVNAAKFLRDFVIAAGKFLKEFDSGIVE